MALTSIGEPISSILFPLYEICYTCAPGTRRLLVVAPIISRKRVRTGHLDRDIQSLVSTNEDT